MKIERKALHTGIASLLVAAVTLLLFGLMLNSSGFSARAEFVDSTIRDSYIAGEEISIPETATVKVEETEYTATFKALIMPDGSGNTATYYKLTATGNYSAVYEYTASDKTHSIAKNFSVVEKNYGVTSTDSTVSYGNINTHAGATGLNLTLSRGDTFTFSKPVKLSKDGPTDIITFFPEIFKGTVPFVGYDKPEKAHHDAQRIIVTMTDCYDPDISISMILYFDSVPSNGVYVRTIATGQGEYGLRKDPPKRLNLPEVIIDGTTYGYYKGEWGGSFFSAGADKNTTNVTWSFDATTNRVYISSGTQTATQFNNLVNDLTNKDIAPGVFPGFTSDDVYVSLTVADYVTNSVDFEIESIGDVNGEDFRENLYIDSVPPTVKINASTDREMYIQSGKEFTVFEAKAYDNNLVGKLNTRVYYNYGTPMQSSVVLNGNKFTPVHVGIYTIEYSAKDSYGNVGTATVPVTVIDDEVMSFSVDKAESAVAGIVVNLPEYTASSKNGDVTVKITAENSAGVIEDINPAHSQFTPKSVGKYTITYSYTDGVDSRTFSYDIDAAANPEYGFIELPEMENIYIKNVFYQIDKINAYSFRGAEPVPVPTKIYASFDGGEYTEITDADNVCITASSSVKFKYQASESSYYETDLITVIDVGYDETVRMENYFSGDFAATPDVSYIDFAASAGAGDKELKFANTLATALFSLKYSIPNAENISSYDIILTDEGGNRIVLSHKMASGVFCVSINGGADVALSGSMRDGNERTVAYDPEKKQFEFSDNISTVTTGFSADFGDYYTLSVVLRNVTGEASVRINRIQNQLICGDEWDYSNPEIYAEKAKGYVEVNSTITVFGAVSSDVLFPVAKKDFTLSVRCPGGSGYATDVNGLLLKDVPADRDYTFVLSQFGDYRVEYNTKDACGRQGSTRYIITSADITAPELFFDKPIAPDAVQTMKVGYKYNIKEFTVSDNDTATEDIKTYILVYNAQGQLVLSDKYEFTPTEEGRYTVYIYSFDTAGNSAYISYQAEAVSAK